MWASRNSAEVLGGVEDMIVFGKREIPPGKLDGVP
jgi:hypothetical protein